jgi:RHS repeat-associated protein
VGKINQSIKTYKTENRCLSENAIESGDSGLTYRYTYGLQKDNVVIFGIPNGADSVMQKYNYPDGTQNIVKLYYHHDHLGTTDYLTDNVAGKVTSYSTYDDWGMLTAKAIVKMGVRMLDLVQEYTGHSYDQVLDLYYAKARMYDAAGRRFAAVDPVKEMQKKPQTYNLYVYCLDNPQNYLDPNGKWAIIVKGNSTPTKLKYTAHAKEGYVRMDELTDVLNKNGDTVTEFDVSYPSPAEKVTKGAVIANGVQAKFRYVFAISDTGKTQVKTRGWAYKGNVFSGYFNAIFCTHDSLTGSYGDYVEFYPFLDAVGLFHKYTRVGFWPTESTTTISSYGTRTNSNTGNIKIGQKIGTMGNTGGTRGVSEVHLHFEIEIVGSGKINPNTIF